MKKRYLIFFLLIVFVSCNPNYHQKLISFEKIKGSDGFYNFPGFKYKGPLRDRLPHGDGELVFTVSNTRIIGKFIGGELEGDAYVKSPNVGDIYGQFKNGELQSATIYYPGGGFYEGGLKDGKYDGKGIHKNSNGLIRAGNFSSSNLNGTGIMYDEKNKITYQGKFVNNTLDGEIAVERNGNYELKSFDKGTDITSKKLRQEAVNKYLEPVERDLSQKKIEIARSEKQLSELKEEVEALRPVGTSSAIQYNEDCSASYKFNGPYETKPSAKNVFFIDGAWYTLSETTSLTLYRNGMTSREKEQSDKRRASIKESCYSWAMNFGDPNYKRKYEENRKRIERENIEFQKKIQQEKLLADKIITDRARLQKQATKAEETKLRQYEEQQKRARAVEAEKQLDKVTKMCKGQENSNACCIYWVGAAIAQKNPQATSSQYKNLKVKPEGCFWN